MRAYPFSSHCKAMHPSVVSYSMLMVIVDPLFRVFARGICIADPMMACLGLRWYYRPKY